MRPSKRPATTIFLLTAAAALPASAGAASSTPAPARATPAPTVCEPVAPVPGAVKFTVSPGKVREGTRPRLRYSVTNVGKTCLGVTAAPYGLQRSGFAGWSDVAWDVGIIPLYIRTLKPGETVRGLTAPLPGDLGAGAFYRVIPKFTPDAPTPVTSAPLDIV